MDAVQIEECSCVIGAFIESRVKEGKNRLSLSDWILQAAKHAKGYRVLTHAPKMVHPGSRATGVLYGFSSSRRDCLRKFGFGTHSLPEDMLSPSFGEMNYVAVSGGAAITYLRNFFLLEMAGKRFIEHVMDGDPDFLSFLGGGNILVGKNIAASFSGVFSQDETVFLDAYLKQLFVSRDGKTGEQDFDLYVPLTSDLVVQAFFDEFSRVTFSSENKAAREAFRSDKASDSVSSYSRFRNGKTPFVCLSVGGAQAQNVSYFNLKRNGRQYLFPSLPPQVWVSSGGPDPRSVSSFVDILFETKKMRDAVEDLALFLKTNPDPVVQTRRERKRLEGEIAAVLAEFTHQTRDRLGEGWTGSEAYALPLYQQAWLDLGFVAQSDLELELVSDWPEKVARDVSVRLNSSLSRMGLSGLGDDEVRNWLGAILRDVSWQQNISPRKAVVS